ncbi:MAG TPA: hypothetical protein VJ124_22305 [Pyrinomonadaceae bacterium]|nr:hypothetical protein [Pyrinomonadaceae bacterium]
MSRRRSRLMAFPVLFLIPSAITAQDPLPDKREVLEQKAFQLLDNVADTITSLRSPGNRIQFACTVADLLWHRDEKRARALFETVTREMAATVASLDRSDSQDQLLVSTDN